VIRVLAEAIRIYETQSALDGRSGPVAYRRDLVHARAGSAMQVLALVGAARRMAVDLPSLPDARWLTTGLHVTDVEEVLGPSVLADIKESVAAETWKYRHLELKPPLTPRRRAQLEWLLGRPDS
jgi:hypothetical protein